MFRNNNVAARIFERQVSSPAPGTSVHTARRFYENIVPAHTVFDVKCPDIIFRKFSDDGQYLVTFSSDHQNLVVYRPTWLSFSCRDPDCQDHELPSKANEFESYFTQLYTVPLASEGEKICKEFFLYEEKNQFGLFATSTMQVQDVPATGGAVPGIMSFEKITFYLVSLKDGVILDQKSFYNDFINLGNSLGVYLYDDLVAIVSLRYQRINVLKIGDSGILVDVRSIGQYCHDDDELFLNSSGQQYSEAPFLGGLKQRLLSFMFRVMWNEEEDPRLRMQCLKKKFHFNFQDYANMLIWKVQFLDRYHLLIRFGSDSGGVAGDTVNNQVFFAVYNLETTEIISFYEGSSDELYTLFELFCDHFHSSSNNSSYMNFFSSHSNNIHALYQLRSKKTNSHSLAQFMKKKISTLPMQCQSVSPSAYFDHSLFRFDEKLISAKRLHTLTCNQPLKFTSRRQPNTLKFKIKPGPESDGTDTRTQKLSSVLFHPILPLVISLQHIVALHSTTVNIHFRR